MVSVSKKAYALLKIREKITTLYVQEHRNLSVMLAHPTPETRNTYRVKADRITLAIARLRDLYRRTK